jgi:hypothetical protein
LNKFGSKTPDYHKILSKLEELLAATSLLSWDSIPGRTVSSYTARNELSASIDEKLRATKNSSISHALVIYGLGGVGKTQLALQFVEEHRDQYAPILWIDAKSPETVRASFERCAGALRLPVDKNSPPGPRQALKD